MIGSLVGVLLLLAAVFFVVRKRRQGGDDDEGDDEFHLATGPGSNRHIYDVKNNPFMTAGAGAGAGAGGAAAAAAAAHGHQHNQLNSFLSQDHDEEYFTFEKPKVDITGEANKVSSEFGRRRLSNGSLPDMATRNPGSLKVVNN